MARLGRRPGRTINRREWISVMIPRYGSATASSITDEELLHLAIAYVKRVHEEDPDFPARVAFLLEALREGRGEWERVGAGRVGWPEVRIG